MDRRRLIRRKREIVRKKARGRQKREKNRNKEEKKETKRGRLLERDRNKERVIRKKEKFSRTFSLNLRMRSTTNTQ